jgi:hypothetical protein
MIYTEEEGGRNRPVFQGLRCDFSYDGDDIKKTGIYMIHPEFEDEEGNVILDDEKPVPKEGTAKMWILIPEMRNEVHVKRIKAGVIGYFMEGSRIIAKAEVVETLGLYVNTELFNDGTR